MDRMNSGMGVKGERPGCQMEREEDRPNKTMKNDHLLLDLTGSHDTI